MSRFKFSKEHLKEVRFPLGGIGAGNVSVDGAGRFVDWEIGNRPNKLTRNAYSHIAVKAERDGALLGARALNGPLQPTFIGDECDIAHNGYGSGPARHTLAGVPHFTDVVMEAKFPVAKWNFDGKFPGKVSMKAFSPFEPINDYDSSLPMGMFEVEFENTDDLPIDYTVAFSIANPFPEKPINSAKKHDGLTSFMCSTGGYEKELHKAGEICVTTDCEDTSVQEFWFHGDWFDTVSVFWSDFKACGHIKPRSYPDDQRKTDEAGTLCAHVKCAAHSTVKVKFVLSWYFPIFEKYWGAKREGQTVNDTWKNWYATQFDGSLAVADYTFKNWNRLQTATDLFVDTVFNSTMPEEMIDAAVSTLAVLKSPTCIRLTDGSFYGWEGCNGNHGSCEGSCQHVWNYQYALPFLFPKLERSMRELDFKYNFRQDGGMSFRVQLPVGTPPNTFRSCADGQFGAVIKAYREWKICGDDGWLSSMWPYVKKAIEYAWSETNGDMWDHDKTGVLHGRQHHTLDMELFGPNSWLTGFYLAALDAGARMADAMGDSEFAEMCREIFEKGKKWVDENLWNGEYFFHKIDVYDKSILAVYDENPKDTMPKDAVKVYWNDELGQIKYQVGEGLSIDAMVGQWHADMCGLGDIFDPQKVETSLKSLMKYNFADPIGDWFNPCRMFSLQDESGLVICTYPEGRQKPRIPVPYGEETMHGFEYAAASHMILRGMTDDGLKCIKSVRDRYDGHRRNPFNELECGSNYARSMAAWSFVNVWLGLEYDMTKRYVKFNPIKADTSSIWSLSTGWGGFAQSKNKTVFSVHGGDFRLKTLELSDIGAVTATLDGEEVRFTQEGYVLRFEAELCIKAGQSLVLTLK